MQHELTSGVVEMSEICSPVFWKKLIFQNKEVTKGKNILQGPTHNNDKFKTSSKIVGLKHFDRET